MQIIGRRLRVDGRSKSLDSRLETESLAADKFFGRYKKEKPQSVRKPDIKENEALKALKEAWQSFKYFYGDRLEIDAEINLNYIEAHMPIISSYTPKDVQLFAIALTEFQDEEHFSCRAGVFLSALINYGKAHRYTLDLSHLSEEVDFLGYLNDKNIKIRGNVGVGLGQEMDAGRIILEGNANSHAGCYMRGGLLVIKGDAYYGMGTSMSGGKIVLYGAAYPDIGENMTGGEIHLNGDPGKRGRLCGGKIYHKGKLIAGKEE